jgi:predicted MFS family arabinose efflux permease
VHRVAGQAGDTGRFRVVALLAGVLMLNSADVGTVGAVATQLERSLQISNTQLGVIAAVSALAGAVGTIPVGILTDRINRVSLLSASIVVWSAAMVASALAPSFAFLVLTRVALGAVSATSGPTLASLTGDLFPARERGKAWGMILTGEVLGSGVGLVGSGNLAGVLGWRYGFGWLAIPGLALAIAIRTLLHEPPRGQHTADDAPGETDEQELAEAVILERGYAPDPDLVLDEDPVAMPIWDAVRYVLRVRTNRIIIVASALAYVFFAGVQTFAVELMRSRYHLSQASATVVLLAVGLGALAGVVVAGRLADQLLRRGVSSARVVVGAVGYMAAAVVFVPALLSPALVVALPLLIAGGAGVAAPDAPLNAARLDVMPHRLWGRAEGVRTVPYMLAFAVSPVVFGFVSTLLGGPGASGGVNVTSHANGQALADTFLIMLVPLAVAGVSLLAARRSYPGDVATAAARHQTADRRLRSAA